MKKSLVILFLLLQSITVNAQYPAPLPSSGPISMQQIYDWMLAAGEITSPPISIANLNSKSHLTDKTAPYSLSDWYGYLPVTAVVPVTNPATGVIWMDRNLGATRAATSSADSASYGDLYQWGRAKDGHQIRTSATTTTLSSSDTPGHGNFIIAPNSPYDWRSPQNVNLWQGVSGTNNPCPSGYRLPTEAEWEAELLSWGSNNPAGAFASPLKLPVAGYRNSSLGSLVNVGSSGSYWSGTVSGTNSRDLYFFGSSAGMYDNYRARGFSVRCLKDGTITPPSVPTIGVATAGDLQATVAYSAPVSNGGSVITSYTATSSPGGITGTLNQAGSGTITVSGLTNGTAYTFTVTATNAVGSSAASAASNAVTPLVTVTTVTSPTGKIWMDRNLGASQVATSSTDAASYGDLYQWGRAKDGHQIRTSATTAALSSSDTPGHGNFIISASTGDWRSSQNNNLWQGVNGINNPCPVGYRLPTEAEWNAELLSWGSNNAAGAFASPLKLPVAGGRDYSNGSLNAVGSYGYYWSGTINGTYSRSMVFIGSNADMGNSYRAGGFTVRCLKDGIVTPPSVPTIGVATAGNGQATVAYTAPASNGGSVITSYTATSSPGGFTGTLNQAGSGTITVSGLTNGTAYTFTVKATNAIGISAASSASNAVTPSVPVTTVTSPTGVIWMDRNLGATQVATSSADAASYGDLYQWGRGADGHQIRTSATTATLSSSDLPGHGNFIIEPNSPNDWRSPQNNNLWQGVSGTNNPCPAGYRLPTDAELEAERLSWSSSNSAGAFASPLKLPVAGRRSYSNGSLFNVGSFGDYWSSTVDGTLSRNLNFGGSTANLSSNRRTYGFSVRCLKDVVTSPGVPIIGVATSGDAQATVAYTAPASNGGSVIISYTATSSPGGFTGTLNQAGSGTITVLGLTNGTAYTFTVKATNAVGSSAASAASASVTPATVPGAPTIGVATRYNGQATVAYTAPTSNGGSVITSYTATSSPGGFTGTLNQAGSGTITVSGLTNGTAYTFTVKATNAIGSSAASSASASVTPATVPGAPTIGVATAGNTQAMVAYTAPASNGGSAITSYTATSSPGGLTGTLSQAGSGTITVSGLTNGTAYTFTVKATNAIGSSAASSASASVTPATVPGAPTIGVATAGNTQAMVAYTAPASNGGTAITSYTATSSPGGLTGTLSQAGSGTITITGLTNGTAYTFTVKATNAVGSSAASAASNAVTPVGTVTSSTGKIWMDRNLGATQVATSSTDAASYGDLYQWGRAKDGHQIRTSATTTTLSSSDIPGHSNFIATMGSSDWRSPLNNNLWQGVNGVNNPCPAGYRLPTEAEWNAERLTFSSQNAAGAFASPLKLPMAGSRKYYDGTVEYLGTDGVYWSSTTPARILNFNGNSAGMGGSWQANGYSVRCIKN